MTSLTQYSSVCVVKLLYPLEEYNDWRINQRNPQIGDSGAIVEILNAPNLPDKYVVEAVNPDGTTRWLSDFDADELEAVPQESLLKGIATRLHILVKFLSHQAGGRQYLPVLRGYWSAMHNLKLVVT